MRSATTLVVLRDLEVHQGVFGAPAGSIKQLLLTPPHDGFIVHGKVA